jgi:hypothetical protein
MTGCPYLCFKEAGYLFIYSLKFSRKVERIDREAALCHDEQQKMKLH